MTTVAKLDDVPPELISIIISYMINGSNDFMESLKCIMPLIHINKYMFILITNHEYFKPLFYNKILGYNFRYQTNPLFENSLKLYTGNEWTNIFKLLSNIYLVFRANANVYATLKNISMSHVTTMDIIFFDNISKYIDVLVDGINELPELKSLHIGSNMLHFNNTMSSEKSATLFKIMTHKNNTLKYFDLANVNIGDIGCIELADALNNENCKLQELILSNNKIDNAGIRVISRVLKGGKSTLEKLTIQSNIIGDDGAEKIGELLSNRNCKLESLRFVNLKLSSTSIKYITDGLIKNPNSTLTSLTIFPSNTIKDDYTVSLGELLSNSNCKLQTLKLEFQMSEGEFIKHITAGIIKNPNSTLTSLILTLNRFNREDTVAYIGELLRSNNCNLQNLDLSYCRIDDAGAKHLADALTANKNSSLQKLDLKYNPITKNGSKLLLDAISLPHINLKEVIMYRINFEDMPVTSKIIKLFK